MPTTYRFGFHVNRTGYIILTKNHCFTSGTLIDSSLVERTWTDTIIALVYLLNLVRTFKSRCIISN